MPSITRCKWCLSHPLLTKYHDNEWGIPKLEQNHLYEHIILEIFQAGLNWLTILKKRREFRRSFASFDPIQIAKFDHYAVDEMMMNAGIIRNRRKIEAAIHNAIPFLEISQKYGGFWNFLIKYKPKKEIIYRDEKDIPAQTKESAALAKKLKESGFKFIGPISAYAYMQSVGIVNDHIESCFRFHTIDEARRKILCSIH